MPLPSLVTLDELKAYIDIKANNTSFDNDLAQLARISTKALETFCRRAFSLAEYTEIFSTRFSDKIVYDLSGHYSNEEGISHDPSVQRFPLKGFPVNTGQPFTVYYDSTRVFAASSIIASTNYYLNAAGNTLYLLQATTKTVMGLKVVYTGGYTVGSVGSETNIITAAPEDLKMACVTQVVFLFNKFQESNIGVRGSKKHSPEYIQNEQMLCPEAQAMAAHYRKLLVGKR